MRLDLKLVSAGLAPTRARARDLILRGEVVVDGRVATKAGEVVAPEAKLEVTAAGGVSRGGVKLAAALDAFGFDPGGLTALDVGASTGGFTEVLLKRGAAKVYAVDVGRDQLHPSLRDDPRVVVLEGCDARRLDSDLIATAPAAIVADVSFISLAKALPAALGLAVPGAWLVALVKPQFEVGRDAVGKGGVVRDEAARLKAADDIAAWIAACPGWRVAGVIASPIAGGSGNREFLLGALLDG